MHIYSQYLFIVFLSNSIVYLRAQGYTSIPARGEQMNAALGRTFDLRCLFNGNGDGEFLEWFKKNATHDVSVNTDKPGHYAVKTEENHSNLTIRIFVQADANVDRWYVKTKRNPAACEFGRITLISSPQGIIDDKDELLDTQYESLRRTEDQELNLKCVILPEAEAQMNRVEWEFSVDNTQYEPIASEIEKKGAEMHIKSVKKYHRGYYRCKLNGVNFTILLRIKDKLAALWPFLGILGTVLVLVIIILIFEKRQKSNKKSHSTDEDDHDRASDPLVRTTTKASDNDSKKRAVKA